MKVTMVTDGATSPNPGFGGWGCILLQGDRRADLSGSDEGTTNNRMEMTAVIEGFRALLAPCSVKVITDSAYVVDQIVQGRMHRWSVDGWVKADGTPVKNQDLWEQMITAIEGHEIEWTLVKGHAGHDLNEQADRLAVAARLERKGAAA